MKKTIKTEFNNCQEFIDFVKPKLENINFENSLIYNKMKTIFSQNQNAKASITNLTKIVKKELGFKAKSTLQLEFYLERGWSEEYGEKLISDRQSKNSKKAVEKGALKGRFSKDWFKERYPDDWEKRYKEKQSKTANQLENYIKKYGKEDGNRKFEEANKKRVYSNSKDGFIEKYGKEVGLQKWISKISKHRNAVSEDFFIKKYGEKEGKQRWSERNKSISYKNSFDYYIEQFGEYGKEILSEKRKRSIDEFLHLYGDEGKAKWDDYMRKLDNRSNIQFSKISQELFDSLGFVDSKYGESEEIIILDNRFSKSLNKNYLKPDFLLGNKIIEFYGDLWHANPSIFESDDEFNPFFAKEKTASLQWDEDKKRIKCLEKLGYKVLIIWESDYINNKNDTIKQCIDFIES